MQIKITLHTKKEDNHKLNEKNKIISKKQQGDEFDVGVIYQIF